MTADTTLGAISVNVDPDANPHSAGTVASTEASAVDNSDEWTRTIA